MLPFSRDNVQLPIILLWCVIPQIVSITLAPNLPDARPPPIQETDYVQEIIDDLLNGKTPELLSANRKSGAGTQQRNLQPFKPVNSSDYWFMDDLVPEGSITDVEMAEDWLTGYLNESQLLLTTATEAGWNYFTNITDFNRQVLVDSEMVLTQFLASTSAQAKQFNLESLKSSANGKLSQLLYLLSVQGMNALPEDALQQLNQAKSDLARIITNSAVCELHRAPPCTLRLPIVQQLMWQSRDPKELLSLWIGWRNAVAPESLAAYKSLLALSNAAATLNGFEDAGAMWRSPYELTAPALARDRIMDLEKSLNQVYSQIRPLYEQLHSFVRYQLGTIYSSQEVPELTSDGPIPAHLIGVHGDSWAPVFQSWIEPYPTEQGAAFAAWPNDPLLEQLAKANYTGLRMFKQAEEFFVGLGFDRLPESFWNKSMLERPRNRDVLCQPWAAFDFKDANDYRIKACAEQVSGAGFAEAHRLLAQTYYQLSYRNQPLPFRESANPSFAAAVADAIAMTIPNQNYMKTLGFNVDRESDEARVNSLWQEALSDVTAAPFQISADLWRWKVFDGTYALNESNQAWWMLRELYQGVKSPVPDSPSVVRLDALSSPLISQEHSPAVRPLITIILKYQILSALCEAAGFQAPLDLRDCNLAGSPSVGSKLRGLMSLGASADWPEALHMMTGSRDLDATPMMQHFSALTNWLTQNNQQTNSYVGWDGPGTPFDPSVYKGVETNDYPEFVDNGLSDSGRTSYSREDVAFTGEDCSTGRTCLQDSICNGTICVCPEHLQQYGLHCLPSQAVNTGGQQFSLSIQKVEPEPGAEKKPEKEKVKSSAPTIRLSGLVVVVFTLLVVLFSDSVLNVIR